ncbi:selenide, water dikinase SelD [Marinobacter nanhaiticus D15-8W]|uniref:Selenide, water dikinase SelD n=1 Tax=Marinobacter nanhaiticus D15-8W TaxID=626887 RepID=N6VUZ9_9GAMM|nr:selenide, water dikinase SelD [Marinobacter nanhaiticus]ENO14005.2 selenide, water dikinase SelD [Marinobacter nanhaiticus D15-8W]
MKQNSQPVLRDIVLIGGGHSHVGVLRRFAMKPVPGVRLTLISPDAHTPYSGMLPGYVAGHYSYDDIHIDLRRLAEFAGARFIHDEVAGLDRDGQQVLCKSRPAVAYDYLSINIGATPQVSQVPGAAEMTTPVKPISLFNERWVSLLDRIERDHGDLRIVVVGGGAGGVELLLAMQYRLKRDLEAMGLDAHGLEYHLFTAGNQILPTHAPSVQRRFERVLRERGVQVHQQSRITAVEDHALVCADGQRYPADEILWVTSAGGAPWLAETGLDLDKDGFIEVGDTLQSLSDERVFAAGDIATMINHPREKAGVMAVRQGPPLATNLRRIVTGKSPRPFRPQKHWLALISTGDRHAVASRGGLGFEGNWVWRWKDWIDRRFMSKFNDLPAMDAESGKTGQPEVALQGEEAAQALSAIAMRCGGCGAKVGASVLSRAIGRLTTVQRDDVLVGLHDPDDAAVMRIPPDKALVHSVDFFRAFIDDPYLFGRIAAVHSLSDLFAMGAEAQTATAVATVPPGLESKVEDTVFQMMSGAVEALNEAGCALVGGHTGEGQELALGFAVNGLIDPDTVLKKGGMQPGNVLILTKPLGTGTLFAAHAQLKADGRWIDTALISMAQSNQKAAECLRAHGATACTDITGFGLVGHLVEMTRPSGVDARIELDRLPLLPGAEETVAAGILSSLQPANVRLRRAINNQEDAIKHSRYPLAFDPQTSGGLLASVPAERADDAVAALVALGYRHTTIVGEILPEGDAIGPISLV